MELTALVVQLCEVARRRNLQTAAGEMVFCLCLCSTLLTRQAFVCRSHLQLSAHPFRLPFCPSLHNFSRLVSYSCTICTTCTPTRQTGGACQVSLLPGVAIDVILWNALHVPPNANRSSAASCRSPSVLFLSIGSQTGKIAAAQARHFNYALPVNKSLTASLLRLACASLVNRHRDHASPSPFHVRASARCQHPKPVPLFHLFYYPTLLPSSAEMVANAIV